MAARAGQSLTQRISVLAPEGKKRGLVGCLVHVFTTTGSVIITTTTHCWCVTSPIRGLENRMEVEMENSSLEALAMSSEDRGPKHDI